MKTTVATIMTAMMFATLAATGGHGEESVKGNGQHKIRFSFEGKEIIVSMVGNSAARSLIAMLPLTLKFEDYAGAEKITYPPKKLDTSDVPPGYDPSPGDLTLYAPWGDLAFFYRDHGYAPGLVPLGKIVSGSGYLRDMDAAGEVRVEAAD